MDKYDEEKIALSKAAKVENDNKSKLSFEIFEEEEKEEKRKPLTWYKIQ